MKTIFRKVDVSERLPKGGFNTVSSGDSWTVAYLIKKQFYDDMYGKHLTFPEYWLEEIELPSEKDIIKKWNTDNGIDEEDEDDYVDAVRYRIFSDGANYILDNIFK